jgi:hypothetical protein
MWNRIAYHQRPEPVLRAAQPGQQAGPDEGRADQRAEDRYQLAVVPADAVDGDGEKGGAHDAAGDGDSGQRAPETWRWARQWTACRTNASQTITLCMVTRRRNALRPLV